MSIFSQRFVSHHNLPLSGSASILHPEQVILTIESTYSFDIGFLCYLRRQESTRRHKTQGHLVDLTSLNAIRIEQVRKLITYFSDEVSGGNKKIISLKTAFAQFVYSFMTWADSNGHFDVLSSKENACTAFREYVAFLRDQVSKNLLTLNSAAIKQNLILSVLGGFLCIDDISRGVNVLRKSMRDTESTSPPCEIAQSKALSLSESLFDGFSKLVLENKPFPFQLKVPAYLEFSDDGLWTFPLMAWCNPHQQSSTKKREYRAYDFVNGKLAELDEISDVFECRGVAQRYIRNAEANLKSANTDPFHHSRRMLANVALRSFVLLFFANTGMNVEQVSELQWGESYEEVAERQGFRVVKWRAGGRECHFEIQSIFLPKFKAYLKLREYILNGLDCDYLFFNLNKNLNTNPHRLGRSVLRNLVPTLRFIDPSVPSITAREWRAAKIDWLIRNTDISTGAIIIQSSEENVKHSYITGSETTQNEEMSRYFRSVTEAVVSREQAINGGIENAVGVCTSYGKPHQLFENISATPDCRNPEGCLFCSSFKVHADERDTRKLISCRYCLHRSAHLVQSEEQFQWLFGGILDRIQVILAEISSRDNSMVDRVNQEVEEGELDPFWASKLELLIGLEMI